MIKAIEVTEENYLNMPYWNMTNGFRKEIFVEEADFVAHKLAEPLKTQSFTTVKTAPHQLRQFYNQVKAIERKAGGVNSALSLYLLNENSNTSIPLERVQGELYALLPKASYAFSRGLVHGFFAEFLEKNLYWAVQDERQFKGFVYHFESVIAYYKER